MKRSMMMIAVAALMGTMTVSAVPVEAKKGGSSAKTTASTASKARPGYSLKKTTRAPARSAASVLKRRAARAKPRNIVPYKSARTTRAMDSARRMMTNGKPAKSIASGSKPGAAARVGKAVSSPFTDKTKPRAKARKVTFRERSSVELKRLNRTPSGRLTTRR